MARALAEAFVRIRPTDDGFRIDTIAQVKKALEGVDGKVKLAPDLDLAKARTDLGLKVKALQDTIGKLKIQADDKDAISKVANLTLRLHSLDKRTASPKLTVEGADRAMAQLLSMDALLDRLTGRKSITSDVLQDPSLLRRLFGGMTDRLLQSGAGQQIDRLLPGLLPSAGGGAGGAAGQAAAAATGGGGALSGLPGILSNPAGLAGASVAALAGLPFIAQAAAGAITFALGGALTGIGVYAEKGVRSVQYQFSQLLTGKQGIEATAANISPAFGQALTTVLSAARTFVPQFIRDFGPALDAIAGPLKSFGVELAGSLASPQVAASLRAVGQAFGGILTALTPAIPGILTAVADGFTNIARAVAKNPKALADLAIGLGHLIGVLLDTIAWLTQVADYIEMHFIPAWHDAQRDILNWTLNVAGFFTKWGHDTEHLFDTVTSFVVAAWDTMWRNTVSRLVTGIHEANSLVAGWRTNIYNYIGDIVGFFQGLPHRAVNALSGWGTDLKNFAANVMNMMLSGFESVWHSVEGFFSGLPSRILHALGIHSPPDWAIEAGQHVMGGLLKGIAHGNDIKDYFLGLANDITGPLASIWKLITGGGGVGSAMPGIVSAARWVLQHGGSRAAAAGVGGVIAGESGGNPEAVQQGVAVPGMGLIQWTPGSSAGPIQPIVTGNPVRDMAAQLIDMGAYIASRGGMEVLNAAGQVSPMAAAWAFSTMEGPLVPGSDIRPAVVQQLYAQGYDKGGWLQPGYTLAFNGTGQPEMITTQALMEELIASVQEIPDAVRESGDQVAGAALGGAVAAGDAFGSTLSGASKSAGYASIYRTRP